MAAIKREQPDTSASDDLRVPQTKRSKSVKNEEVPVEAHRLVAQPKKKTSGTTGGERRLPMGESTNSTVADRIRLLEDKLRAAKARGDKYKKKLARQREKAEINSEGNATKIPKPLGTPRIQHDMGLDGRDAEFDRIRNLVVEALHHFGADRMVSWSKQPLDLRSGVCQEARQREPYLERFADDWATQAILAQHLGNHISYERRKANPTSSYNLKRKASHPSRRGNYSMKLE